MCVFVCVCVWSVSLVPLLKSFSHTHTHTLSLTRIAHPCCSPPERYVSEPGDGVHAHLPGPVLRWVLQAQDANARFLRQGSWWRKGSKERRKCTQPQTQTHRHRHTDTQTHTDTGTDTDTDTHRHRHRHRHKATYFVCLSPRCAVCACSSLCIKCTAPSRLCTASASATATSNHRTSSSMSPLASSSSATLAGACDCVCVCVCVVCHLLCAHHHTIACFFVIASSHPGSPASPSTACARRHSAKVLQADQPNVSYICSRYYRAPELCIGASFYSHAIGSSQALSKRADNINNSSKQTTTTTTTVLAA